MSETPGSNRQRPTSERRASATDPSETERLTRLRAVLPLLAKDAANERRRANALEAENTRLKRRVAELEAELNLARDAGYGAIGNRPSSAGSNEGG